MYLHFTIFFNRYVGDNFDEATTALHAKYGHQKTLVGCKWIFSSQTTT